MSEVQSVVVRDFTLADLDRVKEIHAASGIDYRFPDLSSPLFIVVKVYEKAGVVQACGGLYLQVEAYLFLSHDDWGTPEEKLEAIRTLDAAALHAAWLKGIDCACLYLPPGMERFGERLEELGWMKDRNWATYSKRTQSAVAPLLLERS